MRPHLRTARHLPTCWGIGCALLLSSCAWIPKGDPPADYLEPPEMTETLAEVTNRAVTRPNGSNERDCRPPK